MATLQVNYAYAVLLASQFQRYCRGLHSEAVDHLCARVRGTSAPPWAELLIRERLVSNRMLDRGNANAGNLGADFARFAGRPFWADVRAHHALNNARQAKLDALNRWRNAIAHQDFADVPPLDGAGRTSLRKSDVDRWRSACGGLSVSFDAVVSDWILDLTGTRPW